MDSLTAPPIAEQAGGEQLTKRSLKFFPRKPARLPNPTYRKLHRGSAVGRIRQKQAEYPTDKELLKTLAFFRNATAVFEYGQSVEVQPYNNNKGYPKDEDSQIEEPTFLPDDDDDSIQELPTSKETNHDTKTKRKDAYINRANIECSLSSASSHVINIQAKNETLDGNQVLTGTLPKTASSCKEFIEFCSREIVCPQEQRTAFAVKLYGVQAALLSSLNGPFDFLSQTTNSTKVLLNFREAYMKFLPAMIWTGMFMLSSVYTIMVVWSLPFRLPMISILVLAQLFCLSVLAQTTSGFNIVCGTVRMSGMLFASVGAVCFVMLLVFLVMLVLFTLWRSQYKEQDEMKGLPALR